MDNGSVAAMAHLGCLENSEKGFHHLKQFARSGDVKKHRILGCFRTMSQIFTERNSLPGYLEKFTILADVKQDEENFFNFRKNEETKRFKNLWGNYYCRLESSEMNRASAQINGNLENSYMQDLLDDGKVDQNEKIFEIEFP